MGNDKEAKIKAKGSVGTTLVGSSITAITTNKGPAFDFFRESRIGLHQELLHHHIEFFDTIVSEIKFNGDELTYTTFLSHMAAAFNIELDGLYTSEALGKLEEGLIHLLMKRRGVEVI